MGVGSRTCTKMKFPHLQLAKVPSSLKWAGPSNCPVAGLEVGAKEFLCTEAKVGKYLSVYWGEKQHFVLIELIKLPMELCFAIPF